LGAPLPYPYSQYEAVQIGVFGEMAKKGYIYKGLKPVYWCIDCETALAEAEVEYQEDESDSIYVLFRLKDSKGLFLLIKIPMFLFGPLPLDHSGKPGYLPPSQLSVCSCPIGWEKGDCG